MEHVEILYSHSNLTLTVLLNGKVVGGFVGKIATQMLKKIVFTNEKVEVKNGDIQTEL